METEHEDQDGSVQKKMASRLTACNPIALRLITPSTGPADPVWPVAVVQQDRSHDDRHQNKRHGGTNGQSRTTRYSC